MCLCLVAVHIVCSYQYFKTECVCVWWACTGYIYMDMYVGGESCILKCGHVCCEHVHVPVCGVVSKCKFRLLHTGAGGMIALTILPHPPPPEKERKQKVYKLRQHQ